MFPITFMSEREGGRKGVRERRARKRRERERETARKRGERDIRAQVGRPPYAGLQPLALILTYGSTNTLLGC